MTYSEFMEWRLFLQQDKTEWRVKLEYYLAQIAAEVCKTRVKDPKKVDVKAFYPRVATALESRLADSKAAWGALVGMKLN